MEGIEHDARLCTVVQSHHNLREIFYYMWEQNVCPRGSFQDHVFRLVLFHQSLPGIARFPPAVALSQQERLSFCDIEFYKLMRLVMVADSGSYNLFSPK